MENSAPKRRKTSPTTSVPVNSDAPVAASSDDAVRRPSRIPRPSFVSPTRASLARAHPDILHRRNVSRSERQVSANSQVRPSSSGSNEDSVDDMLTAQLEGASETRPASEIAEVREERVVPDSDRHPPRSPIRPLGITGRPKRTPSKPTPRPLPPPGAQEEELLDPFKGRALRRSPPRGVLPPPPEPEEPELPPTPTEKGISSPADANKQPIGIHSTPTKRRPRRSKVLAERIKVGSSPLKQRPLRPEDLGGNEAEQEESATKGPNPERGKFDPLAERKAERDSLLQEVARLEADLDQIKHPQKATESLLQILGRHALPPEKEKSDSTQNWLEAALNPISFLPFGDANASFPNPFTAPSAEEAPPPPISHHPVVMTAKEELPYLQLFTPLTFSSTVSFLPHDREDLDVGPLLQKQIITVNSAPPGLFTARIDMTVDTRRLSITDLAVPRIEPCSAAELGPFVAKILDPEASSSLKNNVSVLTWAMSEWTRLATKRARLWCQIRQELGTSEDISKCIKKLRKVRRRKGRRRTEDDDDESDGEAGSERSNFARAELLPQLGRASYDLDLNEASIRIQWRIDFDWTGEGRSKIGLLVEAPGKWHTHDDRKSLVGLPQLFDKMVRGGDTMDAVRTVAALLVEDKV